MHDKIHKVLKYDGNPFKPNEVYEKCKDIHQMQGAVLNGNI